jgi:YD repeat-containing protein
MASITTGNGLGLFNTSINLLGTSSPHQDPTLGKPGQGDRVYVNAATGNLVIQKTDEILANSGLDLNLVRTYNSQGQWDGDNSDNWQLSAYQKLTAIPAAPNTANTSVTKVFGDGAEAIYVYDGSKYVSQDGDGAHDTLSYNAGIWTWTDGSRWITETYNSSGQLTSSSDIDGNSATYTYTGTLLTQIQTRTQDASGANTFLNQTTYLDYTGTNLSQIRTVSNGTEQVRTQYKYDSSNRLTQVLVDLTPTDALQTADSNSDGILEGVNGQSYTTTYTYDGTSKRVASITQGDGTTVSFTYDASNRLWKITDAKGGVTTFNYVSITQTNVVDALNQTTSYTYDTNKRLTKLESPTVGGTRLTTQYAYDASGNLSSITDARNNVTTLQYDGNGNLTLTRDSAGNTVTRSYNTNNQLVTETVYITPDPDGAGPGLPSNPLTTRYAYDTENHLRFIVSAEGRVTEYRYNTVGNRIAEIQYAGTVYNVTGLAPTDTLTEAQLNTWLGTQDKTKTLRTDYAYDFRGQLSTAKTYDTVDNSGNGTGIPATTYYVYDQRGYLLQTVDGRGTATNPTQPNTSYASTYTYDGLGRLLSGTQWASSTETRTTTSVYDDANNQIRTTAANGLLTTQVYDARGLLLSTTQSSGGQPLGTTTYAYDINGRLRTVTDPTGLKTHYLYDEVGRRAGEVDGTGALMEYVYNKNNQVTKTIRYYDAVSSAALASLNGVDAQGNAANVALSSVRPTTNSAFNRITYYVYDTANRLVWTVEPHDTDPSLGYATKTKYDGVSRVIETLRYNTAISTTGLTIDALAGDITVPDNAADRRTRYFYDNDGRLQGTLDAQGYLTENLYDAAGQLIETIAYAKNTTSATSATDSFTATRDNITAQGASNDDQRTYTFYNSKGQATGLLDALNYLTRYQYDLAGNKTVETRYYDPAAVYTTQTLDDLTPTTNSTKNHITLYDYNGANQVTQITTNPFGIVTQYTYDNLGRLTRTDAALNTAEVRTTQARYDARGNLTGELTGEGAAALEVLLQGTYTQTDIDNLWATYGLIHTYDAANRRVSTTDQNNNKTLFYYDNANRLTYTVNALGEVSQSVYNTLGQLIDTYRYSGRLNSTDLSTLSGGLVTSSLTTKITALANTGTNPDNHNHYNYNLRGMVKQAIEADGTSIASTTTYTYNAFGELKTSNAPISATQSLTHDYFYDKRGLLTNTIWDSAGLNIQETRTYDAFGRFKTLKDANNHTTEYTYDRLGRQISVKDPLTFTHSVSYDAFGHTLSQTDALGRITNYSYNDTNRSFTITTPESVVTTTTQNRHGQTVTVTDGNLNTTTYTYDKNGNLTGSTVDPNGLTLTTTHAYDRANRKLETTDANGNKTQFTYDAANRLLTKVADPGTGKLNLTIQYGYDGQGRTLTVTEAPNTTDAHVTQYEYNAKGQLTASIVDPTSINPSGLNLRTEYTYDDAGHTLTVTEGANVPTESRTSQYVYDKLGRRIKEIKDPYNAITNPAGLNLVTEYLYDNINNVLMKIEGQGTDEERITHYVYNANDRLAYVIDAQGAVTENVYDKNGRVIETTRYATPVPLQTTATPNNGTSYTYNTNSNLLVANSSGHSLTLDPSVARDATHTPTHISLMLYNANGTAVGSAQTMTVSQAVGSYQSAGSNLAQQMLVATNWDGHVNLDTTGLAAGTYTAAVTLADYAYASVAEVATVVPGWNAYHYDNQDGVWTRTVNLKVTINASGDITQITHVPTEAEVTELLQTQPYSALDFDGIDDAVTSVDPGPVTGPLTIQAWINADTLTSSNTLGGRGILHRNTGEKAGDYHLSVKNGIVHFAYWRTDGENLQGRVRTEDIVIQPGQWYHIVATWDGTTQKIYVNGVEQALVAPATTGTGWGPPEWAIGRSRPDSSFQFDGKIDNVRLYNRALTSNDVQILYSGGTGDTTTGLISEWRFEDARGTTAVNSVNTALNGTLVNMSSSAWVMPTAEEVTHRDYDKANRVTREINPEGGITATEYDAVGNIVKVTDPNGGIGYFYYGKDNRIALQIDPEGYATETKYDALGNTKETIKYANKAQGIYNESARPILYDGNSASAIRSSLVPDPTNDPTTHYVYDSTNRLKYSVDALGYVTETTYDAVGNVTDTTRYANPIPLQDSAVINNTFKVQYSASAGQFIQVEGRSITLGSSAYMNLTPNYVNTMVYYHGSGQLAGSAMTKSFGDPPVGWHGEFNLPTLAAGDYDVLAQVANNDSDSTWYSTTLQITVDANGDVTRLVHTLTEGEVQRLLQTETRYALTFDGIDDAVTFADPGLGTDSATSPLTIQAWIKGDDLTGVGSTYGRVILHGNRGEKAGDYYLSIKGGNVHFAYWQNDGEDINGRVRTADVPITAGQWYHVVATWDGANQKIYVNGVEQVLSPTLLTTGTGWGSTPAWSIGRSHPSAPFQFDGKISDVRLYTGALSATEIANLYADENVVVSGTLKARWKFDDAAGTTTANSVDPALNGTLTNMASNAWVVPSEDRITHYVYDPDGRQVFSVDAMGAVTETVYDNAGNVVATRAYANPLTAAQMWVIDISIAGATPTQPYILLDITKDQNTKADYDALGRTTKITDAETYYETFDYDAFGNVIRHEDKNHTGVFIYEYDANNNKTKETLPVTSDDDAGQPAPVVNRYEYDAFGNMTKKIEAEGLPEERVTQYFYNKNNQQTDKIELQDKPVLIWTDAMNSVQGGTITPHVGGTFTMRSHYDPAYPSGVVLDVSWPAIEGLGDGDIRVEWFWNGQQYDLYGQANPNALTVTVSGSETQARIYRGGPGSTWMSIYDPQNGYNGSYAVWLYKYIPGYGYKEIAFKIDGYVWVQSPGGGGNWDCHFETGHTTTTALGDTLQFTGQSADAETLELWLWANDGVATKPLVPAPVTKYTSSTGAVFFTYDIPQGTTGSYRYEFQTRDAQGNVLDHVQGTVTLGSEPVVTSKLVKSVIIQSTSSTGALSNYIIDRSQEHNAFGEIISETDGRTNTTTFAYNVLGQLIKKVNPLTSATQETGRRTPVTPTTHYYYDRLGRSVGMRMPLGNLTTQRYDEASHLLAEYHFDFTTSAPLTSKQYSYDIFGNKLKAIDDQLNETTKYTYDHKNQLIKAERPTGDSFQNGNQGNAPRYDIYAYDEQGRRIKYTNALGYTERTHYDDIGRVRRTTSYSGINIYYDYIYDLVGGGTTIVTTQADGKTLTDTKDYFGRLLSHTDLGGHVFEYSYNKAGWLTHQQGDTDLAVAGFEQDINFTYYQNGYLKEIIDHGVNSHTRYEYDENGNRTFEGIAKDTGTGLQYYQWSHASYDALNRVTQIVDPKYSISYEYDENGNRRHIYAYYHDGLQGDRQYQDYWYRYDAMDRFVVTKGVLQDAQGNVIDVQANPHLTWYR